MTNELTTQNDQDFINSLNEMANIRTSVEYPKMIKFNAEDGMFLVEKGKDIENKTEYTPLGEKLEFHLLTTRNQVSSKYDPTGKAARLYSKEFIGNFLEILNENKEVIAKGFWKDLKFDYPNLQYSTVLYVVAGKENKLYRLKLSGSKLHNLYPYLGSFQNDSPALRTTIASKGKLNKISEKVQYYDLNFTKWQEIDKNTILERMGALKVYFKALEQVKTGGIEKETGVAIQGDNYNQIKYGASDHDGIEQLPIYF